MNKTLRRLLAAQTALLLGLAVKKTTIGGQALIEGIMMKGPQNTCICVRKPDGELTFRDSETVKPRSAFWKLPVARGAYNLLAALREGVGAINYSAAFFEDEDADVPPSKFDRWLENKLGSEKLEKVIMTIALITGIIIPVGLFILAPTLLVGLVPAETSYWVRNLLESGLRILFFLFFMWSVSHMKDIRRTFEYHGGEHKTIFCYEAGEPLTVENVRRMGRFHPRCGTSFLFVVMIISILVFSFVQMTSPWARVVMRLVLLPLVVGLAYECNRFAGRHDNWFTAILRWPGLQLQRLTVFEPDDSMMEVAIAAMNRVIPADDSDQW